MNMFQTILKQLRESHNLSQAKFAKELGVVQSTVGMWENGKNKPEYDTLIKIANYFSVSVDYLIGSNISNQSAPKKEGRQDAPLDDMDIEMLNRFSSLPEVVKQHVLQYLDLLSNGMIVSGGAQLSEAQQEILRSRTEETPEDQNIDSHKDAG